MEIHERFEIILFVIFQSDCVGQALSVLIFFFFFFFFVALLDASNVKEEKKIKR